MVRTCNLLTLLAKQCYNAGTSNSKVGAPGRDSPTVNVAALMWSPQLPRNVYTQGAFVEGVLLESAQLAKAAVDIASDKKASDIILLDIREVSTIADYFVICTGNNRRQIQAIADALDEQLEERGAKVLHHEGVAEVGWILLDFGDVIVHIFGPKEREYYRLESLWSGAKTVVYLQ